MICWQKPMSLWIRDPELWADEALVVADQKRVMNTLSMRHFNCNDKINIGIFLVLE